MSENSPVPWLSLGFVVVGLAVLLYGAFVGHEEIVIGGGVVVMAGIGILTTHIARLPHPTHD